MMGKKVTDGEKSCMALLVSATLLSLQESTRGSNENLLKCIMRQTWQGILCPNVLILTFFGVEGRTKYSAKLQYLNFPSYLPDV